MHAFTVSQLPPPPPGRTGWPWTTGTPPLPPTRPNGSPWPRITIVTPSFNQGAYLEETIRSVLLQGYPNLEYLVMDGGSTDQSPAIIRKYERFLDGWVSRRDKGQSDAINQGFARATGELFNWICSDDYLVEGALGRVAAAFASPTRPDVVVGGCLCQYDQEPSKNALGNSSVALLLKAPYTFAIWQPSCFFRRTLVRREHLVREDLHYCMDRELWCHLRAQQARWLELPEALSVNRFTGENKSLTGKGRILSELDTIYRAYFTRSGSLVFFLKRLWLPLVLTHLRHPSGPVRGASRVISRAVTLGLRTVFPRDAVQILQKEYYRYSQ